LASLRQLLNTLLETVQVRLELLGTELEAEKRRLVDALVFSAIALVCLALGLVLVCATVVLMVPQGARLLAVGALAVLFLATGWWLLRLARRRLRNPLGMFHASAKELARDRGQT
jgi:uncharacterized membrane protein YqjE